MSTTFQPFAKAASKGEAETTTTFQPAFDEHGLIPAIVSDHADGQVLMFAWMNGEALDLTLQTKIAHFWSRSRRKIWKKGEESGNTLAVRELLTDCDQDVLWLRVDVAGDGVACHTKRRSCFYRTVFARETSGETQLVYCDN